MYMVLEFRANVTRNPFPKQVMTHLYLNLIYFSAVFILKSNNVASCNLHMPSHLSCRNMWKIIFKQSNPYLVKISMIRS